MKKLLFVAAGLMIMSSAMAQSGADVKINGELRARFTGQENTPTGESKWDNETEQRTKIGFNFTKSEDLMAHVTLLAAGTWGNEGDTNISGQLNNDADAGVLVYEAFAFWKAMDNFSVRLGRGVLELADGSVVAKNDYMNKPYSFEGALATYYHEMMDLNVFAVKGMNDTGTDGDTEDADINFYGLSANFKLAPEYFKMFNFHALQSKATGINGSTAGLGTSVGDERLRLGVTLAGDVSAFDWRVTYAMQTGEIAGTSTIDSKASMMDLEAGFKMPDMMNFRVHAIYHSDSGDENLAAGDSETYDSFYYDYHRNAGLMDIVGWGNLNYIKLGVALEPAEMLTAGLDYYMFKKSEKADSIYGPGKDGAITGTSGSTDDDIGSEIDLWAKKTLSNGAEIVARYGMFQAGDAWGAGKEDVSQYSLEATFRF